MDSQNPNQPTNFPQEVPQPQTSTNRLRILFIVLLAIFLLSAVGIGAYFLGRNQINQPQITQSSPAPITDPTANWKTYTNGTFSIFFRYPPNFVTLENELDYDIFFFNSESEKQSMKECILSAVGTECNIYSLGLKFKEINKSSTQDLKVFVREDLKKRGIFDIDQLMGQFREVIVDERKALQGQFPGMGIVHETYIDKGESTFYISANAFQEKDIDMYKKMLSAFKFTK